MPADRGENGERSAAFDVGWENIGLGYSAVVTLQLLGLAAAVAYPALTVGLMHDGCVGFIALFVGVPLTLAEIMLLVPAAIYLWVTRHVARGMPRRLLAWLTGLPTCIVVLHTIILAIPGIGFTGHCL